MRNFAIFMLFSILLQCAKCRKAESNHYCQPSSCGAIKNVSYPFRLKGDPISCGDPSYELVCDSNRTILYLNFKRYYVLSISYSDFTIRVVDPLLSNTICAAFQSKNLPEDAIPRAYLHPRKDPLSTLSLLNNAVVYMVCEAPAKSRYYVDFPFCSKQDILPQKYSYVVNGEAAIGEILEDSTSCNVEEVAWIADKYPAFNKSSFLDIQDSLSHGFLLPWYGVFCRECSDPINDNNMLCEILNDGEYRCNYYCFVLPWHNFHLTRTCFREIWARAYPKLEPIPVMIVVRFLCGVLFMLILVAYKIRRRHLSAYDNIEEFLRRQKNFMPIRYTYRELKNMTKNFKDKLGEGGYGTVFKGQLRSGPFVAVKMMGKSKASGQEFISEVATIGRIHHVNVVQLIGFFVEGPKRALIYEFMPNGSLEKYIFSPEITVSLNYSKMFEIALGVAKGIGYLHRGCDMQILHFDIKPQNILLDDHFNPKISDFGLAKLYPTNESMVTLTAARGTMGYMAPEMFYRNIGKVSYKSDVYSYGMLLMEMASKRRNLNPSVENISQIYFPCWVHDIFSRGMEIDLGDASLDETIMVKKMIFVSLWCIQMKPVDRPSMTKVIEMLEGDVRSLQLPPKPFLSTEEMLVQDDETDPNNMDVPLLSG